MAAVPPRSERRRPRPGSLERPVNGRLYRGTWLIVGLPLLLAAFSVARPTPLPPPQVPSAFDGNEAKALAMRLAGPGAFPNRFPGSFGAQQAAAWFKSELQPYGLTARSEPFTAKVAGLGRLHFQNLVAVVPGRSVQEIVVMAHRDNDGMGPGANDNASGTAALVELAQAYSVPTTTPRDRLTPAHTIVFLSTDGGAFGGIGAAEFLAHSPERHNVVAVVNLDAIGGAGRPRLLISGDTAKTASGTLLATAAARVAQQVGRGPSRPSALRQLVDLGFPFTPREQGPFISRGIPAVTLTTVGSRPQPALRDTIANLNATRLGQLGRAAQDLIGTLDQGLEFAQGTSSYVYVGSRLIRGWAVELVLMAMLLPFLTATVDLFARCRRRRIPLAPALRSYRSRLAFWLWAVVLFELFDAAGVWPGGVPRPPGVTTFSAHQWPAFGLALFAVLLIAGWLIARDRLIPRRPVRPEEELAGHTAALLCVAAVSLLVVATNPFALLFVLPSAHAWLWLPNLRDGRRWARLALLAVGFVGPALILWSFAFRYGLGWDAPLYILQLRVLHYVPFAVMPITAAWLAGAAQLATLATGRYAPYPAAGERSRLGPGRRMLRRLFLSTRARKGGADRRQRALG